MCSVEKDCSGETEMRLLALDISQNSTGYAVVEFPKEKIIKSGYIRNPQNQSIGEYTGRVRDHVQYLIVEYMIDEVVMEDLFMAFNMTAKKILQIHGPVKEITFRMLKKEAATYAQQTWRHKILGIKKFTKKEKEKLEAEAKKVKGKRYKNYFKNLCSIKHKVIEYVNKRMKTEFVFEQNDMADAVGLCLAHYDEVHHAKG
jgi:Holliday junction resolvasome RuvABC endonuclease subunit